MYARPVLCFVYVVPPHCFSPSPADDVKNKSNIYYFLISQQKKIRCNIFDKVNLRFFFPLRVFFLG